MSSLALTFSQARYVNKAYWRNPARAFASFALPLLLLIIFTSILGNGKEHLGSITMKESTYYVAAMAAFGVLQACFSNLAASVVAQRDAGILKRIDGTPLPKVSFVASRILHSVLVAVILVVITTAFGRGLYSASIPTGVSLVEFLVMLVVGAASFCALGLAVTALIPNSDATQPVILGTILPLCFLSGIFVPFGNSTPSWLLWVAKVLPLWHFGRGMLSGFVGLSFDWTDVLVVAAWGALGLVVAIRYFTWQPRAT